MLQRTKNAGYSYAEERAYPRSGISRRSAADLDVNFRRDSRIEMNDNHRETRMAQVSKTLGRIHLFASLGPEEVRALDLRCIWRKGVAGQWMIDDQSDDARIICVQRGRAPIEQSEKWICVNRCKTC